MAGLGYHDFQAGAVLTAAQVDGYLMNQAMMYFDTTASRDTALPAILDNGLHCYVAATRSIFVYDKPNLRWIELSSAWTAYTPVWTNLTVGDASWVAQRRYENGAIHCAGQITLGATSSISGTVSQTIPDSLTTNATGSSGTGITSDSAASPTLRPHVCHAAPGGTSWTFITDAGALNATVPSALATGDVITWDIVIGVA